MKISTSGNWLPCSFEFATVSFVSLVIPKCTMDGELTAGVTNPDLNRKYECWNVFEGRKVILLYIINLKSPLAISPYSAARVQAFNMGLHSSIQGRLTFLWQKTTGIPWLRLDFLVVQQPGSSGKINTDWTIFHISARSHLVNRNTYQVGTIVKFLVSVSKWQNKLLAVHIIFQSLSHQEKKPSGCMCCSSSWFSDQRHNSLDQFMFFFLSECTFRCVLLQSQGLSNRLSLMRLYMLSSHVYKPFHNSHYKVQANT